MKKDVRKRQVNYFTIIMKDCTLIPEAIFVVINSNSKQTTFQPKELRYTSLPLWRSIQGVFFEFFLRFSLV